MARAIISLVNTDERTEDSDPTAVIKKMIDSYSRDMPTINAENKIKPDGEVVLLTGSTGGLGSYLLASLIADERVKKIYALNRPSAKKTSLAWHETTFRERSVV
jgi:FlaA1/EpsC-like NDP-sugar epimerase